MPRPPGQTEMNEYEHIDEDEPLYVISIAARIVGMHAQTLRQYERVGLVEPKRTRGNIRLYSRADVARLRQVQRLINDLGVNLAGVEVILRMGERMQAMEREMDALRAQLGQARPGDSAGMREQRS
jgi:MerR family transcriptional regulator/heat shock protein HspR